MKAFRASCVSQYALRRPAIRPAHLFLEHYECYPISVMSGKLWFALGMTTEAEAIGRNGDIQLARISAPVRPGSDAHSLLLSSLLSSGQTSDKLKGGDHVQPCSLPSLVHSTRACMAVSCARLVWFRHSLAPSGNAIWQRHPATPLGSAIRQRPLQHRMLLASRGHGLHHPRRPCRSNAEGCRARPDTDAARPTVTTC